MWFFLSSAISAVILTTFQIAFLSHLFPPFSDLHLPLAAISYSIIKDRPLTAAVWAVIAGTLLDMHGLFGFGTETALLFSVFLLQRLAFARFLTNASAAAVFLLSGIGVFARFAGLLAVDGLRVLFGEVPYAISPDPDPWLQTIRAAIFNGLIVVAALAASGFMREKLQKAFLPARGRR